MRVTPAFGRNSNDTLKKEGRNYAEVNSRYPTNDNCDDREAKESFELCDKKMCVANRISGCNAKK